METSPALGIALVLVVATLGAVFLAWHVRRSRELVDRWAEANGYTIDAIERRYFRAGPFFWRRGRGHEVFHVVVRAADGTTRGAYLRTGGWLLGQVSEEVAVRWEDEVSR